LPARWGHLEAALAPCAVGVVESDRWTAMQYGRGAQMMVMRSVFVGRGVRVDVRRRAGVVVVGTGAVVVMTLGYSERLGW